ncbi:zf-TFIIB domain-containing protein [Microbacterium sp. LMC-P-041]|uniref:TFIIB-type zinc ribbon-containing protein n=1 Tax=Microbacterium sp. LMC-P-041 TaxID=3040293 RepID=UPI0033057CD7
MDDLQKQRELHQLRDDALSTPNCAKCLHPMEPAERDGTPVWSCPDCGADQALV